MYHDHLRISRDLAGRLVHNGDIGDLRGFQFFLERIDTHQAGSHTGLASQNNCLYTVSRNGFCHVDTPYKISGRRGIRGYRACHVLNTFGLLSSYAGTALVTAAVSSSSSGTGRTRRMKEPTRKETTVPTNTPVNTAKCCPGGVTAR